MESSDLDDIQLDYNKLERDALKVGLREGLSAGQEVTQQQSAIHGINLGIKVGYVLGYYEGVLKASKQQQDPMGGTPLDIGSNNKKLCAICSGEVSVDNSAIDVMKVLKVKTSDILRDVREKSDNFTTVLSQMECDFDS